MMLYTTVTIMTTALFLISSQGVEGLECPTIHFRIPPIGDATKITSIQPSPAVTCPVMPKTMAGNDKCSWYVLSTATKLEYVFGCPPMVIAQLQSSQKQEQDPELSKNSFTVENSMPTPPSAGSVPRVYKVLDGSLGAVGVSLCHFGAEHTDHDVVAKWKKHLGNYPNFEKQHSFTSGTAGKQGMQCAAGTFFPAFDPGQVMYAGDLKPVEQQWQSDLHHHEQFSNDNLDWVMCFYKVVAKPHFDWTKPDAEMRIEYGIQLGSLCPTTECQLYGSADGGICCCDTPDCNNIAMKDAFEKVQNGTAAPPPPPPPTTPANIDVETTTEVCSDNIVIVAVLGATAGILLLIAVILVVVLFLLKRKKREQPEEPKVATPAEDPNKQSPADAQPQPAAGVQPTQPTTDPKPFPQSELQEPKPEAKQQEQNPDDLYEDI